MALPGVLPQFSDRWIVTWTHPEWPIDRAYT
jgi:hypothetical protein